MNATMKQMTTIVAAAVLSIVSAMQAYGECTGGLRLTADKALVIAAGGGGAPGVTDPRDSTNGSIHNNGKNIEFRVDTCYDVPRRRLIAQLKVENAVCPGEPEFEKEVIVMCRNAGGAGYAIYDHGTGALDGVPVVVVPLDAAGNGVQFGSRSVPIKLGKNEFTLAWALTRRAVIEGDGRIKCKLFENVGGEWEWNWKAGKVSINYDVYDTCGKETYSEE
jgi:hypothetical protein